MATLKRNKIDIYLLDRLKNNLHKAPVEKRKEITLLLLHIINNKSDYNIFNYYIKDNFCGMGSMFDFFNWRKSPEGYFFWSDISRLMPESIHKKFKIID